MAKVYKCPECYSDFTTARIKKNDSRCPNCSTPLRHTMGRPDGGSMEHDWVIDDERSVPKSEPVEATGPKYKIISPDDNPEIFKLIESNSGDLMDFQVVYRDKFAQTHLRCQSCNTYLHTTQTISGGIEETYCRATVQNDGEWSRCKTRTRFVFLRRGAAHEINV